MSLKIMLQLFSFVRVELFPVRISKYESLTEKINIKNIIRHINK